MSNDIFKQYESKVKQEVNRYKELIASERFLSGGFSLNGYAITHNPEQANDLYTNQDPPSPYFSYPDLLGEVVLSVLLPFFEIKNLDDQVDEIWRELNEDDLWPYINREVKNRNLRPEHLECIDDFIHNDFLNIIAYKSSGREIDENKKIFLEKQIEVYQNGGFPCGWKGKYPEGEMVVYSLK